MDFYDNLSYQCIKHSTSPSALLRSMGKSASRASEWKRNGNVPSVETVAELAKALGCKATDLVDRESLSEVEYHVVELLDREAEPPAEELDDNERELLRVYRSLTKRQAAELMAAVYAYEEGLQ